MSRDIDPLLSEKAACLALGVSKSYLRRQVKLGLLALPLSLGPRMSRWRTSDIQAFIDARSTPAYTPEAVEQAKALSTLAVVARKAKREAAQPVKPGRPRKAA